MEKNLKSVYMDDGRRSTNQNQILKEITKFYQELYKENQDVRFTLSQSSNERLLSDIECACLDEPFIIDEFYDAAMTLKSNKVPGLDGLTIEFYRKFWRHLSPFLFAMYEFSFKNAILPESVRQGLISLLPKQNKNSPVTG